MIPGPDFEVQGTHRDKPGGIEVHVKERDVFYVVDGEATIVAGGR
jgi:mannose-6-phosphate isomerase-like protein (cupin superfamily)